MRIAVLSDVHGNLRALEAVTDSLAEELAPTWPAARPAGRRWWSPRRVVARCGRPSSCPTASSRPSLMIRQGGRGLGQPCTDPARTSGRAHPRRRWSVTGFGVPPSSGGAAWCRGRGSSGCEDSGRRYDLYQGKRDTYSGRRGGAWSPTRGRSGRTSSATRVRTCYPGAVDPRPFSSASRGVHQMFLSFSKGSAPPWYSSVRLVGGPWPPLGAPTNRRAGHRPWD